jgi:hypothetical protein
LAGFIFGVLLSGKVPGMKGIPVVRGFWERDGGIDSGELGVVAA